MRTLRLPSFAKINLGLEVLGPRGDGYHELRTIFQTISLRDEIGLTERPRGIEVRCDHEDVPTDGRNLAVRAARELARATGVPRGATIRIEKRIPVAAGLGGGSSNAAVVLLGLDRLWGTGLGPAGLQPLARRIGADVPFFLCGGTALGVGRGDEVYPLRRQVRAHIVLVAPSVSMPTARVFRRHAFRLTVRGISNTIFRFVSRDLEGESDYSLLVNDLERAALEEAPGLGGQARRIRRVLAREGALVASLSGSGAAFFGMFAELESARRARQALEVAGFAAQRVATVSLSQYRRLLGWPLEGGGPSRGQTR